MNFKDSVKKIFSNIYFLYFISILSFLNILGYFSTNNVYAVVLFSVIAVILTFFEKNMSIVLTISLILTTIFISISGGQKESMDNMDLDNKNDTKLETFPFKKGENVKSTKTEDAKTPANEEKENNGDIEGASEKLLNSSSGKSSNRIDLAATLEESYDNLNNILGTDGINKLTNDTSKLMNEQKKLFESMKMMSPLLNQAKEMLEGFDMKQINSMVNTASSFLQSKQ